MSAHPMQPRSKGREDRFPQMPTATAEVINSGDLLHSLRHFHLGNPKARGQLEALADDLIPALLNPYRDASRLRYDYPLFLMPPRGRECSECGNCDLARPLGEYLNQLLLQSAPADGAARILKDNIAWIERDLRKALEDHEGPVAALPLLQQSSLALQQHLALDDSSRTLLQQDIDHLLAQIPTGGTLLSYGRYPALHLLIHVIRCKVQPRHLRFNQKITKYIKKLEQLIDVDDSKSASARAPERLKESIGHSAALFNPNALASVMKHSQGSVAMPLERRARIEKTLQTLKGYNQNETLVRFIHNGTLQDAWLGHTTGFAATIDSDPCSAATQLFDQEAGRLAQLFRAVRTAELETENRYDPAIHDPWFKNFNWEVFTSDELLLVPAIIALESADQVAGSGMPTFSRLLSSGRPVQVFVRVQAHNNPGALADEDPFQNYRTELGYFGISHRQAVISQASAARHQQLLDHYTIALDTTRTSLHLINVGLRPTGQELGLNAWLVAGAALEGRVHPSFLINPAAGDSALEQVHFAGNPQPERDWPLHRFSFVDQDGKRTERDLAFTFADYALLIPRLHSHFAPIPAACHSEELMDVDHYLQLEGEELFQKIPYIWAVDRHNQLHRLVVTRALIHACRDRLNFWHTLQEMAGVKSRYIDLAIERTKAEIQAEADAVISTLKQQFEQQLTEARALAAKEVMGRLTDVLLGLDLSGVNPGGGRLTTPTKTVTVAANTPSRVVDTTAVNVNELLDEPEERAGYQDPWIDSALCTSCNDCLVINPIMFVYNEDKQAYITDPESGTYAQLVEAAEICPSHCIHPGQPLNSSESDLATLIERAKPFN